MTKNWKCNKSADCGEKCLHSEPHECNDEEIRCETSGLITQCQIVPLPDKGKDR